MQQLVWFFDVVLQQWNVKATSKNIVPALDYITMNRNSAKSGIISAKEIRKHRQEHPIRLCKGNGSMFKGNQEGVTSRIRCPLPSDKNPNFTYGKPTRYNIITRPSTPVAMLTTHRFQQEQSTKNEKVANVLSKGKKGLNKNNVVLNRKSVPRKLKLIDKPVNELFKMSKFKKIPAIVGCHRFSKPHLENETQENAFVKLIEHPIAFAV
jgi:hypothetical protein